MTFPKLLLEIKDKIANIVKDKKEKSEPRQWSWLVGDKAGGLFIVGQSEVDHLLQNLGLFIIILSIFFNITIHTGFLITFTIILGAVHILRNTNLGSRETPPSPL